MSQLNQWDERYAGDHFVYGTEPNAWLKSLELQLPSTGRALALADGEGRNGVWLAARGLEVLAVDSSVLGLDKARRLAQARGCAQRYHPQVADLLHLPLPEAQFQVVVQCFLHLPEAARQAVHAASVRAMAPGGFLVLECFTSRQLAYHSGGPKDASLLYEPESLREDFADLQILHLEECVVDLNEGPLHQGPGAVVRLLAQAR